MSIQLQRMKEEDDTSSNKSSLQDYLPSYNVESKPSQKNQQTPKKSRNIFEEKPWEPKPKHDFTPWEDLMNKLWKNFFKRNSLCYLRSLWLEFHL